MFKPRVSLHPLKTLTKILKNGLLSVSKKSEDDLILIRHA